MRRREFLVGLVGMAASWPLAVRAQQDRRVRRVGVLTNGKPTDVGYRSNMTAFAEGLQKLGWVEGQNVRMDYRWTGDEADLAKLYAVELVGMAPEVILCSTTDNLIALQHATRSIPIVFTSVSDPVEQGFVASLARPGGNITGFTAYEFSIGGKWLDLLKQMAPALTRVAVMFNPDITAQSRFFLRSIEAAASALGVQAIQTPVRKESEIQSVIESFARTPNGGLILPPDTFTRLRRDLIAGLASRHHLPSIAHSDDFARSGVLMSYGYDQFFVYRDSAIYIDRILKGAKAADLPIQQASRYTFVVNRKMARAMGVEVPLGVLLAADEVIE
jgi:putative ABC transport system substrate-binding protein